MPVCSYLKAVYPGAAPAIKKWGGREDAANAKWGCGG